MEQEKPVTDASSDKPESTEVQKVSRRLGVAQGKFVVPDDIDVDNDLIAELFYGSSEEDDL
jgi:hypothetical protein